MLRLDIPGRDDSEFWDEKNEVFIYTGAVKPTTIQLEHSLVSVAKWESKWHKPFLHTLEKSTEEVIDYIRCMTITQNVRPEVYECLTEDLFEKIKQYIEDPMTATWFSDKKKKPEDQKIITAEIIYYQMVSYQIPFECEKWHLNRLLTLLRVCGEKNKQPEKRTRADISREYAKINAERRKAMHSKG